MRARLQELAAEGNLHNMNIFSPSMIRQLDLLAKKQQVKDERKKRNKSTCECLYLQETEMKSFLSFSQ